MANRVPDKLSNYNVYVDAIRMPGVADITLPSLEPMTEEVKGAGILGSYETPVMGHFTSSTMTINFRTPSSETNILWVPVTHLIECRAALQRFDAGLGTLPQEGYRVTSRAMIKKPDLGKMEVAAAMENNFELEVFTLEIFQGPIEILMLDKANFVYRVLGVDYSKAIKDLI